MALGRRGPTTGTPAAFRSWASICLSRLPTVCSQPLVIRCRMSRKGECLDNAVAERFFGSLKRERTDLRHYVTRQEARADVVDYIEMFYNSKRLHSYLGYVSPQ